MRIDADTRPCHGRGVRLGPIVPAAQPMAACSSAECRRSQRRHAAWSGTRDASSADEPRPVPEHAQVDSACAATASSASGGRGRAASSNDRFPFQEQLAHRLVVSRSVTRAGRRRAAGRGARWPRQARHGRAHGTTASRMAAVARRPGDPLDHQLVAVVGTDPRDARRPDSAGAGTTRTRCGSPRYRTSLPSSSAGRASSLARDAAGVPGGAGSTARARRGTLDDPLGTGPAAPAGGRDRDDDAAVRLDGHPQAGATAASDEGRRAGRHRAGARARPSRRPRQWRQAIRARSGAAAERQAAAEREVEGHVPIVPALRPEIRARSGPGQASAMTPSETRNPARRWSGGISVLWPTGASPGTSGPTLR